MKEDEDHRPDLELLEQEQSIWASSVITENGSLESHMPDRHYNSAVKDIQSDIRDRLAEGQLTQAQALEAFGQLEQTKPYTDLDLMVGDRTYLLRSQTLQQGEFYSFGY